MGDAVIIVLFYWSPVVPFAYLLLTRNKGLAAHAMRVGLLVHLWAWIAVYGLVHYESRAGNPDAIMGWFLILPVNLVFWWIYGGVLARHVYLKVQRGKP